MDYLLPNVMSPESPGPYVRCESDCLLDRVWPTIERGIRAMHPILFQHDQIGRRASIALRRNKP